LLEFLDTAILPIVDGGYGHTERYCCLLIAQPSAHDHSNCRLLIVRQVPQGCREHPCVDPGHARAPNTRFRASTGSSAKPISIVRGEPTCIMPAGRLERSSRTLLLVIPLADEVLTDPEEITHGDLARFEIFETEKPKKHFLHHVLGTLGPHQAANERLKRPVMLLIKRTDHRPSSLRNPGGPRWTGPG